MRISMYRSPFGPAVRSRLAVAARADPHAFVDARRNLDLERLVPLDAALAVARHAGLGDDLAAAVTGRAGLLDAEEALAHLHRAGPWQVVQVIGLVPGFAPLPLQVSQASHAGIRICVSFPCAASSSVISIA
jgi:hypothetical protein